MWQITYPDGSKYSIVYDHCTAFKFVDPTGQTTELTRDKLLAITRVTNSLNQAWVYGYDSRGLLATFTDPLGQTTRYTRDASGRLIKVKNPLGSEVSYKWDGPNITEMTDQLNDDVKKAWINNIPLKRGGTPEDVANTTLFLASELSSYISGQTINVCGAMNT